MNHHNIFIFLFCCFTSASAEIPFISADCQQNEAADILSCDYRWWIKPLASSISIHVGQDTFSISPTPYPYVDAKTMIFFLVDVSDPKRRRVVQKNIEHIRLLLKSAKPHQRFALAGFASQLEILAPPGVSAKTVEESLAKVKANGFSTKLYEHSLSVIELLKKSPEQRKAIFLFSDGLAEDKETSLQQVIEAARAAQIQIYTLGYFKPGKVGNGYYNLEALAKGTGGEFIHSNEKFVLPATFLTKPFQRLDSGGLITYKLDLLKDNGLFGKQSIKLTWHFVNSQKMTEQSSFSLEKSVTITQPQAEEKPTPILEITSEKAVVTKENLESVDEPIIKKQFLIYLISGILIILLIWLSFLLFRRKPVNATISFADSENLSKKMIEGVSAYLRFTTCSGEVYPITVTPVSIGRNAENDIQLDNVTVSAFHAEICYENCRFFIRDTNSTNGVLLDGKQVEYTEIENGSQLEIGEVVIDFVMESP
ncbi:FHA domain-containing protein [Candidatus Venteria ishoeyi]|uniref:Glycogen accumulation regulator GarA n=1 Tax=Candidatus Venteria ishoeyi TaxID=1899563 RepID=A0A1H6F6F3_9GAMM|nr:FHA domain-containing protein [Candidatus Venteria ishoeyi]SEH04869.1 Glycogen accumulation regulator GarA [Candidatus Venteria ishoeyi]